MTRTLVVGAGLAGLTAAYGLHMAGQEVQVLEARPRVGGRALSPVTGTGAVDLGPAWIWPAVQPRVMALLSELGLETLPQDETGAFVYETAQGLQSGHVPARYGDTRRVRGGTGALAGALAGNLPSQSISFDSPVRALDLRDKVRITTQAGKEWVGDKVIVAVPGPLVAHWSFTPALPAEHLAAMTRWPTWMAAHAKLVATYDKPFWRDAGYSGSAASRVGPLVEIVDHSDPAAGLFALFGFVGWSADDRADSDLVTRAALDQLGRMFGPQAATPNQTFLQDWATETFTTTASDRAVPAGHPPYGSPAAAFGGRVLFAGAEVSHTHGGLIEGAIETGEAAARAVLAEPARV